MFLRHGSGGLPHPKVGLSHGRSRAEEEVSEAHRAAQRPASSLARAPIGQLQDSPHSRRPFTGELDPGADPGELAVAVIAALRGGYLFAETMQGERHSVVALDMALDHMKALVRTPVVDLTQSDN